MRLIVGGYAQGKRSYLIRNVGIEPSRIADGASCSLDTVPDADAVINLHLLIRRLLEAGFHVDNWIHACIRVHPEMIFVCDEVGCGVVPMGSFERAWREAVGHVCCSLAQEAAQVDRICCGVAATLKGQTEVFPHFPQKNS